MKLDTLLKGKKVNVMTDAKVVVQLEIESAEESHHSQDLEPATRANDWWPPSREWTTIVIKFTNGYTKQYNNISEIKLSEDEPIPYSCSNCKKHDNCKTEEFIIKQNWSFVTIETFWCNHYKF